MVLLGGYKMPNYAVLLVMCFAVKLRQWLACFSRVLTAIVEERDIREIGVSPETMLSRNMMCYLIFTLRWPLSTVGLCLVSIQLLLSRTVNISV
jgi:hypothetical protein